MSADNNNIITTTREIVIKVELIFGNSESFATNNREVGIIDLIKSKSVEPKAKVTKRGKK